MKNIFTKLLLLLLCIFGLLPLLHAQNVTETFDGYSFSGSSVTPPVTYGPFVYNISSGNLSTAVGPAALYVGNANAFSISKTNKSAFRFVNFTADGDATLSANVTGYLKGVAVTASIAISIPTNMVNFDFSTKTHFDDVDSVVITGTTLNFFLEDWTYNLSPVTYAPFISANPASKTVCTNSNTSFTVAGTDAPTSYTWQYSANGGSLWTTITGANAGAVYTNYTSSILGITAAAAMNGYLYRASASNAVGTSAAYSSTATLTVNTSVTWNGGTSNNWTVSNNWTGGCAPSSTIDAVIPIVATQPVIQGGASVTAQNLTIANGASLTIASGSSLTLSGASITNNGSVKGAGGTVAINAATQATFFGNGTYGVNLQLANSTGAIIGNTINDTVKIISGGILQLTAGTLTSRDKLMLVGDATGCGYIGNINSPNTVSGKVIISNYTLTAQRGYRMMGHPFTDNIPLSSLLPYVDISGNSSGGFTVGAPTSPSAYYFNPATSTGTGGTGGWIAYSSTSQTWNQANALLLFVRGKKGEGLNNPYGYSISAPAISLTGTVNTTSPNITLQSSAYTGAAGWSLVPNVLPTPVYVYPTTVNNLASAGVSTSIYVWNPLKGRTRSDSLAGGYDAYLISSAPVIPMFGAFFVKNTSTATGGAHIGDVTIKYNANATADGVAPLNLLRVANTPYVSGITFTLESDKGNVYWDKLYLLFQKGATSKDNDPDDFEKMNNAGLNMYTVADGNRYLAVDTREIPTTINEAITLGVTTQQQRLFTLRASDVIINKELYLHDKYLSTWTKIENNMQYEFAITADTASKGNNRFEISVKENIPLTSPELALKTSPNPFKNQLNISYTLPTAAPATIIVTNANGQVINTIDAGTAIAGTKTIGTLNWASGLYFIQLKTGNSSITKKIVKE